MIFWKKVKLKIPIDNFEILAYNVVTNSGCISALNEKVMSEFLLTQIKKVNSECFATLNAILTVWDRETCPRLRLRSIRWITLKYMN